MVDNTTGIGNVALGMSALQYNIPAMIMLLLGKERLIAILLWVDTALGYFAGTANTTGSNNVFIGNASWK